MSASPSVSTLSYLCRLIGAAAYADLIVLDQNPFKVPVTTVHQTKVEMALINGEVVYQSN